MRSCSWAKEPIDQRPTIAQPARTNDRRANFRVIESGSPEIFSFDRGGVEEYKFVYSRRPRSARVRRQPLCRERWKKKFLEQSARADDGDATCGRCMLRYCAFQPRSSGVKREYLSISSLTSLLTSAAAVRRSML